MVSFTTVRLFLYLALSRNMCMKQIDVKSALLNGLLSVDISVMSPHGGPDYPPKCSKLRKPTCGLKEAHFVWHHKLCQDFKKLRFEKLTIGLCALSEIKPSCWIVWTIFDTRSKYESGKSSCKRTR